MSARLAPPEAGGDPFLAFSSFKGSAFLSKVAGGKRCPRHKDPVRVSGECRETLTPALSPRVGEVLESVRSRGDTMSSGRVRGWL